MQKSDEIEVEKFQQHKYIIFVGDLAKYCNESCLRELISPYGHVENVRIVRGYEQISLNYGFVALASNSDAINAIRHLNGVLFMGRYIKVAHACRSELKKKRIASQIINSVYVRFKSLTQDTDISEIRFRSIFEKFGNVEDVSLKIVRTVNHKSTLKHGYGFIHYEPSKEGTNSAIHALYNLNNVLHEDIHFICEPSKNLIRQFSLYQELPFYLYAYSQWAN